ncbi:hypothetical protein [Catenuloplanes atrovinosus]|uniref:Tetratricopeptide repeat protein n=1 Tax=Catenuloplanes atrovinosus TaxID=137266 RepID=A0AAE3YR81_9ACTN|nr:hypothetical protein [Catenuloplanes atrovinosus]MDR7276864.1 hypothetical protein [Catenuloplanes atrovinosus]
MRSYPEARQQAQQLADSGDLAGAQALLTRVVDQARPGLAAGGPELLATMRQLAGLHVQAGDHPGARRLLEEAYAAGQQRSQPADPVMVLLAYDLAVVADELANRLVARRNFALVAEHGPAALGESHPAVVHARGYVSDGTPAAAENAVPAASMPASGAAVPGGEPPTEPMPLGQPVSGAPAPDGEAPTAPVPLGQSAPGAPAPGGEAPTTALPPFAVPAPSQPVSGVPGYGQPVSGGPGSGQPVSGVPGYGQPVSGGPGSGQPVSGVPGYGQPVSGGPGSGQPVSGVPGYGQPVSGGPGSGQPVSGVPGYGPPGPGMPGYGQPVSGTPGYGPPVSGPGYGQPVSGAPDYGQPMYGGAGYGQPVSGAPGFGQPVSGVPGYGPPVSGASGYGPPIFGAPAAKRPSRMPWVIAAAAVVFAVIMLVVVLVRPGADPNSPVADATGQPTPPAAVTAIVAPKDGDGVSRDFTVSFTLSPEDATSTTTKLALTVCVKEWCFLDGPVVVKNGVAEDYSVTLGPKDGEGIGEKWTVRIDRLTLAEFESLRKHKQDATNDGTWGNGVTTPVERLNATPVSSVVVTKTS